MNAHWSRRAMLGAALSALAVPATVEAQEKIAVPRPGVAATTTTTPPAKLSTAKSSEDALPAAPAVATKGKLTDQSLGTLLKASGIDAAASEQRYDFGFKATVEDAEWDFSMSAVLSHDGSSLWIMAWLAELPKSAADVPRTALLRLLAENDKLGKGKAFAYIPANRRFVLQRAIPNENVTGAAFRAALEDLGQSVVATHAIWYTPNWSSSSGETAPTSAKPAVQIKESAPQSGAAPAHAPAGPAIETTSGTSALKKPAQSAAADIKTQPAASIKK